MSRFLFIGAMVIALSRLAVAQTDPSQTHYNLANLHTYLLSPTGADWQTGRSYARSLGGHLVTINDGAEQAFINDRFSTVASGFWIGLNDAAVEGIFEWENGEPVTFTNWCNGEPNNVNGIENYVHGAYTPGNFCWNDISSPYLGPNSAPNQALIELPAGIRVDFDYNLPNNCNNLPTPLGAPGNPDGISWNGAGAALNTARITRIPFAGMPVTSQEYLIVRANGPVDVPLGGPFLRPANPLANEVRIPIPAGTRGVSYAWEFLTAETLNSSFKDGMSIAVVDAAGRILQDLDYADVSYVAENGVTPANPCSGSPANLLPVGFPGVQTRAVPLPPLPEESYLSIVCWNGADNSFPSAVVVDAIQFWGTGSLALSITAPLGPGSLRVQNTGGIPGSTYVTAITLAQGAFPNGWLYGLDIAPADLLAQVTSGPPFAGILPPSGSSSFVIPGGVPPGLTLFGVSLQFVSGGIFGGASAPEHFVTQ